MKGLLTGIFCLLTVISANAIRTANVHFTASAVTLDGALNEAAWATADSLTAFAAPWGDSAHLRPSCVKLLWDATNFYIGARISDSNIVQTATSATDMYSDDMLEFHISPDIHNSQVYVPPSNWDTSNAQYFYIIEFNLTPFFNPDFRKARPDGRNYWMADWNKSLIQTSVVKNAAANYYIVEMAIPFAALDTHYVAATGYRSTGTAFLVKDSMPATWQPAVPPVNGRQWKFNVTRSDIYSGGDCFSTWCFNGNFPPTYGGGAHFHDHNNFGILTFTNSSAVEVAPAPAASELLVSPNPFVAGSPVSVTLPAFVKGARLGLYDVSGKCVLDLTERLATSPKQVTFGSANLASGVYCLKLVRPDGAIVKKTVLMK